MMNRLLESLTTDEVEFRATIHDFASRRVMPGAAERDRTCEYPSELVSELVQLSAMGISVPTAQGGLGLPTAVQLAVIEEVAFADAALASIYTAHYLALEALRVGSQDRSDLVGALATGQQLGAFALTEPDAGSDIGSMASRAVPTASGWRLEGTKTFISNAREADVLVVFAKTDPPAGLRGISCFAVPRRTPGLEFSPPQDKCGLRSAPTYTVFLDRVNLPVEALIGAPGEGGTIALRALNAARIDIAAMASGVAARALDLALGFAGSRRQFGRTIGEFQAIQLLVGEMVALLHGARLTAWDAAARRDRGEDIRTVASIAKYLATESCFRVVDSSLQIHGGAGFMRESEVERLYRDCRVLRIYEGTSQIQLLGIARGVLGTGRAA